MSAGRSSDPKTDNRHPEFKATKRNYGHGDHDHGTSGRGRGRGGEEKRRRDEITDKAGTARRPDGVTLGTDKEKRRPHTPHSTREPEGRQREDRQGVQERCRDREANGTEGQWRRNLNMRDSEERPRRDRETNETDRERDRRRDRDVNETDRDRRRDADARARDASRSRDQGPVETAETNTRRERDRNEAERNHRRHQDTNGAEVQNPPDRRGIGPERRPERVTSSSRSDGGRRWDRNHRTNQERHQGQGCGVNAPGETRPHNRNEGATNGDRRRSHIHVTDGEIRFDLSKIGTKKRTPPGDPQHSKVAAVEQLPAVRIKTEPVEIEDKIVHPPTPPLPRRTLQEETISLQPANVLPSPDSEDDIDLSIADVIDHKPDTPEEPPPALPEQANESPGISNFFTFSSTPQPPAPLPNAMSSEIQPKPVTLPMKPSYHCHRPEDEFNYGGDDPDKIKTIPVAKVPQADLNDSDSEGESYATKQMKLAESTKFSKHHKIRDVYRKYDFEKRKVSPEGLGVHDMKHHILRSIKNHRVTIVEGFTGCGKTTQVPQYIMDACYKEKKECHIVVTQPRRIAALSVAKRVCYERNWQLPSVVGYQVGMENKTHEKDTILTFMTTGVLLEKLISAKSLKEFTHIIIDEVHERDLESDFLLLVIKRIMAEDRTGKEQHVRLILMSATIDTRKFQNYFVFEGEDGEKINPARVKISSGNRHSVKTLYLDHLLQLQPDQLKVIQANLKKEEAGVRKEIYDICVSCIVSLDDAERESNPDPRRRNDTSRMPGRRGAVLVFLPGMEEIKRLQRELDKADKDKRGSGGGGEASFYRWVVLPLHSSVTVEDQARVFDPVGDKFRKIILSTNIAESSVTVSDISYVIDFCLTKALCVDTLTNFNTLKMTWAAKSQCIQRGGRTGRVAAGKVYRLIPQEFFDKLEDQIRPEMQRSNLETIVLKSKKFGLGSPTSLLKDALDRPKISGIQRAVATLKELGALTIEMKDAAGNKSYSENDGDLTFVGRVMTALPIPQQCTRLILLGHCFGVMREATIIAAALNGKSPFKATFHQQLEGYLEKMKHAKKSFSDLFAIYNVYKHWDSKFAESGSNPTGPATKNEWAWAKTAMVHLPALKEMKTTIMSLDDRLKRLGIDDTYTVESAEPNGYSVELTAVQGLFLKLAIAGAFYPQYFLRAQETMRRYENDIKKKLSNHNPLRTLFFEGFPSGHKGPIYAKHIARYLEWNGSLPTIHFQDKKVFATFDNVTGEKIGPFNAGMFRGIKLRQLSVEPLELHVLPVEEESRVVQCHETTRRHQHFTVAPRQRSLPKLDWVTVPVEVTHITAPDQFWVVWELDFNNFRALNALIKKHLTPTPLPANKLCPNCFCLAPFQEEYFRAKVLRSDNPNSANGKSLVYFVDYGNTEWVTNSTIYDFSPLLVKNKVHEGIGHAIECRLKELKPNNVHGLHWSPESIAMMKKFCNEARKFKFDIFSVHQGVVIGDLIGIQKSGEERSLIAQLLSKNESGKLWGEFAPEPKASMENHWKRVEVQGKRKQKEEVTADEMREREGLEKEQVGPVLDLDFIQPPSPGKIPVTLKGPRSPLEMGFKACVKCTSTKSVVVDRSSVNSVLLDHEPTVAKNRMLVAAQVSVSQGGACMVRESTVMPAIPGILSLVALLFSPKVELRTDSQQSMYTGLVCGCGTVADATQNGKRVAVHPDNSIEIVFDTEIDDADIDRINEIRSNINLVLRESRVGNKRPNHRFVRDNVIKLLSRKRQKMEEIPHPEEFVWDKIREDQLQKNDPANTIFEHCDIFGPHQKIILSESKEEVVEWDGGY